MLIVQYSQVELVSMKDYVQSRRVQRELQTHHGLAPFLRYVWQTYVGPNANFRPSMWNVYDRTMDVRTNNNVERFH